MAELLGVLGAVGAGLQFAEASAKVLIKTIHVVKSLREVPYKLQRLLTEVEKSTSFLEHLCCDLLHHDSEFYRHLESFSRLKPLVETVTTLHKALDDMNEILAPMAEFGGNTATRGNRIDRLWKSVVSLKMERELPEKFERLNRLNAEVVRELSVVELQVQVSTNKLAATSNKISVQGFNDVTAQLAALSADIRSLRLSVSGPQIAASSSFYMSSPRQNSIVSLGGITLDGDERSSSFDSSSGEDTPSGSDTQSEPEPPSGTLSRADSGSPYRRSVSAEERRNRVGLYLRRGLLSDPKQAPQSNLADMHLDLALFSIRTFYTKGNFDATPAMLRPRFWKDCSDSIYFFKVSDLTKARRLLQQSTAVNSEDIFTQGSATALIEILSTLAPINTAVNPDVRKTLLLYLHGLAVRQLPRGNPILLVLSRLHEGMDSNDWSLRALTCIVDRLCSAVEPTNEVRLLAQKRLIALLRRSRDYEGALRVCNKVLADIGMALGPGSLQERRIARMLEHIYMDQCEWVSALDVCFDIVSQSIDGEYRPNPDPQLHDECAVWTMEDIAKIYECNGNLEMAIAWLKQARVSAGICWGKDVSLDNIQDKLVELLNRCGMTKEAEFWNTTMGSVSEL